MLHALTDKINIINDQDHFQSKMKTTKIISKFIKVQILVSKFSLNLIKQGKLTQIAILLPVFQKQPMGPHTDPTRYTLYALRPLNDKKTHKINRFTLGSGRGPSAESAYVHVSSPGQNSRIFFRKCQVRTRCINQRDQIKSNVLQVRIKQEIIYKKLLIM